MHLQSIGVRRSDIWARGSQSLRNGDFDRPVALGQEISGEIVQVGSNVDPARVGELVSIEPRRPCRTCELCRSGRYNLCPVDDLSTSFAMVDGSFREFVSVASDFAFEVPAEVSADSAALVEPLARMIAAVRRAKVGPHTEVLLASDDWLGLVAVQVARAFGASAVYLLDPDEDRRRQALRLQATHALDPAVLSTTDLAPHAFIDMTGSPATIGAGVDSIRPGGIAVLVSDGVDRVIPLQLAAHREISVSGVSGSARLWPTALSLLRRGDVDLDSLVTHRFGLDQVADALSTTSTPGGLKRIIKPRVARLNSVV